MKPLRIAIPSGRMLEDTIEFFKKNLNFDVELPQNRELIFFDVTHTIQFMMVRNQDVPLMVLHGGADAGVCGRDLLFENQYDVFYYLDLPFGFCRLSLAIPEGLSTSDFWRKIYIRIATKYPNLTKDFFFQKGMSVEIIKLHGSIEVAPILKISDGIVDLVSTGKTLKENQLKEIETLMESQAIFIINKGSFYNQFEAFQNLFASFRKLHV
ncbi:MAG: ATP phosphoribosyltransferase [Leptospiraceae bacterium]|nr:ATP phosphoribosyltransferase [Leptospiraceae bacterium]MDW7976466.1 ATP phosphoribosyltransferase [Leptospiraceae bacterium]